MRKMYEIYSDNIFKYTDKDKHFLSIYTVQEYLAQDPENIHELNRVAHTWALDNYVLAPYSVDVSVHETFEDAFLSFFDNNFRMLYKVLESEGFGGLLR